MSTVLSDDQIMVERGGVVYRVSVDDLWRVQHLMFIGGISIVAEETPSRSNSTPDPKV